MGIQIEFNPDLALRKFGTKERTEPECLPERLETGGAYPFLKRGQRNYWLEGEIHLSITEGEGRLSRPVASITIIEVKHRLLDGKVWTAGTYRVNEVYDIESPKIHFEGFQKR